MSCKGQTDIIIFIQYICPYMAWALFLVQLDRYSSREYIRLRLHLVFSNFPLIPHISLLISIIFRNFDFSAFGLKMKG